MKKTLQAVIFDLDGVIVDTVELYYLTNKKIADQLSLPFTQKDNEKFKGIGRMKVIDSLVKESKKEISESDKKRLAEEKNLHYVQLIETLDKRAILPGMETLIKQLKENGMKLAIASSSTNAKTVLKKVGLLEYFDAIVDPNELKKGKPDPEIFMKAAEELNVQPKNCIAIEDGVSGLMAIKNTEMFSVGIGDSVRNMSPDWYVESTEEISYLQLLKKFEG